MGKNILITGNPGVGKTTLIIRLGEGLDKLKSAGFYTSEIREHGERKGFELVSLDGKNRGILSHVNIKSPHMVGKYRVDVKGFERFLDSLDLFSKESNIVIIDEIGKMECLSGHFKKAVEELLDSDKTVIATIALKGIGFTEEIKRRRDVRLFEVTLGNRDSILEDILREVKKNGSR